MRNKKIAGEASLRNFKIPSPSRNEAWKRREDTFFQSHFSCDIEAGKDRWGHRKGKRWKTEIISQQPHQEKRR